MKIHGGDNRKCLTDTVEIAGMKSISKYSQDSQNWRRSSSRRSGGGRGGGGRERGPIARAI